MLLKLVGINEKGLFQNASHEWDSRIGTLRFQTLSLTKNILKLDWLADTLVNLSYLK